MDREFRVDVIDAIDMQADVAERGQHALLSAAGVQCAVCCRGLRRVFDQVQGRELAIASQRVIGRRLRPRCALDVVLGESHDTIQQTHAASVGNEPG